MSYRHISITTPKPYRSPMVAVCEHAANLKKGNRPPLTRAEIIRNINILAKRQNILDKIRFARRKEQGVLRKITILRPLKNKFHATGLGMIEDGDFETFRLVALSEGYTHYRKVNGKTLIPL